MLEALFAGGVVPDVLVGTSVGALNAAYISRDPSVAGALELQAAWGRASRTMIFPVRPRTLALGFAGRIDHLVSPRGLTRWIQENLGEMTFEDAAVPFHAVATDLRSGEAVVLSSGPVLPALLATTSLPGIFPPVVFGDRPLVDGGISADVPVTQAEELGAREIWALPTSGPERFSTLPRGAFEVLLRSIGLVLGHVTREHLAKLNPSTVIHVLPAPVVEDASILDFRHTDELIRQGRDLAAGYLRDARSSRT